MKVALRNRVLALVSSGVEVGWGAAPRDNPLPYVVMWEITRTFEPTADDAEGMQSATVQIDIWGTSYKEVEDISNALATGLNGWSSRSDQVHAMLPQSRRDFGPTVNDTDAQVFRQSLDFEVFWW